ncbi:MAG TPA: NAD(P)-dependent oxidoreductase [Actinomycetota bacterium]|nr:NAD(P)-dependent oxidoreductase [Actinomycetota bacterium]
MSERVAFVGLGAMGSRMARRLIDAGYDLHVWNRTRAKAEALASRGAVVADSPAEAASSADAVITMVADPAALADVSEDPSGIAVGVREGTVVIEMSTVGPAAIARLREALPRGTDLVDAPVLGSLSEAEAGELRVFVGGSAGSFERVRPLLEAMGSPLHAGDLGAGAAAKLVANSTLFGSLGVLGEALALADSLGLDRDTAFEVLSGTPVAAQAERRRGPIESGEFPLRFALSLALKDADLVTTAGPELRLAAAARSWLAGAEAAGLGDADYSRVLTHIIDEIRRTT